MTERVMLYTQFAGVTLHNGTTIRQIAPLELSGNRAIVNIFYLSSGVKFDVDAAGDGRIELGSIRAHFRVTGSTHAAASSVARTLQGVLNKRASLVGVEYGVSSGTNYTCTARCVEARPSLRVGLPMVVNRQYQIEVEMAWERFSGWA